MPFISTPTTMWFAANGWTMACSPCRHPKNLESPHFDISWKRSSRASVRARAARLSMGAKIDLSSEARDKIGALLDEVRPESRVRPIASYHQFRPPAGAEEARHTGWCCRGTYRSRWCPAYTMPSRRARSASVARVGAVWNAVRRRCIKTRSPLSSLIAFESGIHRLDWHLTGTDIDRM